MLSYASVEQVGGPSTLPVAMDCIIDCLQYKTHFSGSTAELNYLESFEKNLLDLWLLISKLMHSAQDSPEV